MTTEVIYQDGSTSAFRGGGSFHDGRLAIERLRLITARSALSLYLRTGLQLTHNGAHLAVVNVIAPLTGKTYKRSRKGKEQALADCQALLNAIEDNAVIYEQPTCDVCGMAEEDVVWCGTCGCCQDHCQDFYDCGEE